MGVRKPAMPNIDSALIMDPSDLGQAAARHYLQELGVTNIYLADTRQAASKILLAHELKLVILDWDILGAEALASFNRIRRDPQHAATPIMITSHELHPNDIQMLSEFPGTSLLHKPYTEPMFLEKFEAVVSEIADLDKQRPVIEALLASADDDRTDCVPLARRLSARLKNPTPVLVHAGRRLRELGNLQAAKRVLDAGLESDGSKLPLYTELGRVHLLLGEDQEALQLLRHAQSFAKGNIDRVLMLGELELRQKNPRKARAYFGDALAIDDQDTKAQCGLKVAERMEEYLAQHDLRDIPKSFAGMMNAMAVALARTEQYKEAVAQYEAAISYAPSERDACRIAFNVGLAHLRWQKIAEAKSWFDRARGAKGSTGKRAAEILKLIAEGRRDRDGQNKAQIVSEKPSAAATLPETTTPAEAGGGEVGETTEVPKAA